MRTRMDIDQLGGQIKGNERDPAPAFTHADGEHGTVGRRRYQDGAWRARVNTD